MRERFAALVSLAALVLLVGCGSEPEPAEPEPAEPVALGGFGWGTGYAGLPAEGGELEVISGFQGGVHVEPGLRFDAEHFEAAELSGVVALRVRRLSDGEVITEGATFPFEPYSFGEVDGGWVYHAPPVVFAGLSDAGTLVGERVRLEADVEMAGEASRRELRVEAVLVDEVDELGGR